MTVSADLYEAIDRIYMAAGEITKDGFCNDFKKYGKLNESLIVECLVSEVEELRARQKMAQHENDSMVDFLILQAEKWSASDLRRKAIEKIGVQEYIRRRLEMGFGLWEDDRKDLLNILAA